VRHGHPPKLRQQLSDLKHQLSVEITYRTVQDHSISDIQQKYGVGYSGYPFMVYNGQITYGDDNIIAVLRNMARANHSVIDAILPMPGRGSSLRGPSGAQAVQSMTSGRAAAVLGGSSIGGGGGGDGRTILPFRGGLRGNSSRDQHQSIIGRNDAFAGRCNYDAAPEDAIDDPAALQALASIYEGRLGRTNI
jgi:hypothetical protein